jgi:hypothetical protein
MARLPAVSDDEARALASRFRFTPFVVPDPPGAAGQTMRDVHPALQRLQAWVSSMGASAALADLDGDGLPNDLCLVDPRVDAAFVRPVPGSGDRYEPFAIAPSARGSAVVPTGCAAADLNEDGLMDVIVHFWGRTPVAFLRKAQAEPAGGAAPISREAYAGVDVWPGGEAWNTNAVTIADLDGDGHLDLIVANYFPDSAMPFDRHATAPAPLPHSMSRAYNGGRNRLLRWSGAGSGPEPSLRFADVSGALVEDVLCSWTHAVGAADLDGDGLVELFFANDFAPDRLLHNRSEPGRVAFAELRGRRTWTTPMSKTLGFDTFKGMGVDFGDINGDAVLDIYVSNISIPGVAVESHFLFASEGPVEAMRDGVAPYVDRSEPLGLSRSGWAWDCKLVDFDSDGTLEAIQAMGFIRGRVDRWPELQELLMVNDELMPRAGLWPRLAEGDAISGAEPDAFFVRTAQGRYIDVARHLALEPPDAPRVTRGIATADVDGDGDIDFVLANQWDSFVFYRNDSPQGAFLGIRPTWPAAGGRGTRPAVGATVIVRHPSAGPLVTFVDGGSGHTGRRSPEAHIGLGEVGGDTTLPVEIVWRDAAGLHRRHVALGPGWHTVPLDGTAVEANR